ncbi:tetratricopeptide repeat protein 16-like [Watersipora subatra]|uniref:tetratricopeptide repeat protein 16-like n=1 Tax=Watersipora subatra TaxID=2589382 RepID=UPI00355AF94C
MDDSKKSILSDSEDVKSDGERAAKDAVQLRAKSSGSSTKLRSGILKSAGSRGSSGSQRTRFSAPSPDEATSRQSAAERAKSFIYTPPVKPVNVHQFYATLVNEYEVQPGLVFYDEDTEDEEEEGAEGEGPADITPLAQNHSAVEERPESVLTDVTIDGLGEQDLADMSGVQIIPAIKQKTAVMSLSTVDERQAMVEGLSREAMFREENENANNNQDIETEGATSRSHTQGTMGIESPGDGIFNTAVDEWTLDAARQRHVQDAATDTKSEIDRIMTDKLRSLYNEGLRSKSQEQYGAAIRTFTRIIAMKPESVLPYVQRAECYLMTADFKSAIQNYKKAYSIDPQTELYLNRLALIFYLQGQSLFDAQDYTGALECFAKCSEIKPSNDGYHTRSIACLAALQRHGECLAIINKRLEDERNNTDLYVMRSRLHLMFKNIALCYYDLKDALALDPEHAEAKQIMAEFRAEAESCRTSAVQLALQNRHRDALQKISSAIEYDPTHANFHIIRGALHRHLSDFNSAVDDYLLAMDKSNHDETSSVYQDAQRQLLLTYNDFAIECFKKKYFEEAIMLINKALKGEQREKGLYVNRGDCFFRCNDFQFALADYHQALELDPSDDSIRVRISVIHNEYGTQEYQQKNYSEAESRFTLAIKNNPKISHYYLLRARARYMLENQGGARTDILTAMHLNPDQENTISLTSRLFPGKSIDEIMSSKPSQAIKQTLQHILSSPSDRKLTPVNNSKQKMSKREGKARAKYKACVQEEEFNRILAREKMVVHEKVKIALSDRQSLKHKGPTVANRLPAPQSEMSGTIPKTGWRTFTQGISVRDGSS